ncbi:hypothetical protein [Shouchella patagoniensis]|uniref:hypothetical protein n=1 Tax=Shouchella patagoniensis TaxID=228576 RepID=UPI000994F245|nr:hypothetical protein [Shouchella patagoniensis]
MGGIWRKVTAFQRYEGDQFLVFTYDAWWNTEQSVLYFVSSWHNELIQADIKQRFNADIFEVEGEVVIATVDALTFTDEDFERFHAKLLETSLLRFLYELAARDPELNYGLEALLDEND